MSPGDCRQQKVGFASVLNVADFSSSQCTVAAPLDLWISSRLSFNGFLRHFMGADSVFVISKWAKTVED